MIFIFSAIVAGIIYALFIGTEPFVAWVLGGVIAFLGGIWAGYDERVNR